MSENWTERASCGRHVIIDRTEVAECRTRPAGIDLPFSAKSLSQHLPEIASSSITIFLNFLISPLGSCAR